MAGDKCLVAVMTASARQVLITGRDWSITHLSEDPLDEGRESSLIQSDPVYKYRDVMEERRRDPS